jgi:hypothetical protein
VPEKDSMETVQNQTAHTSEFSNRDRLQARIRIFRKRQWFMLILSLSVILAAFSLKTLNTGKIQVTWLPQIPIPELCGTRLWFDTSCPGCGLTRSFIALAEGDISTSLQMNRIGWIMALALLAQIPYRIYMLNQPPCDVIDLVWPRWFGIFLITILIGNWLLQVISGQAS